MKAGIIACSNGQTNEDRKDVGSLTEVLAGLDVQTVCAAHLYAAEGSCACPAKERAEDLMAFYRDDRLDVILDISGGDLANEILGFLDYETIAASDKTFWGYSDLTTVINAVYAKSGKPSVLYQAKNLVWSAADLQQQRFAGFLQGESAGLFDLSYAFLQGTEMEGIAVGGNIRCLLKLAGTPYWPDMTDKILVLESLGGQEPLIASYFAQLKQTGALEQVAGILLGTFTRFELTARDKTVFDLLAPHIRPDLPVAKTGQIGHGADAKAIWIGKPCRF